MKARLAGFTLLEVMIAMAILAITLVVAFQSQSQSIAMAANARAMTTLGLLAKAKLTEIDSMPAVAIDSGSGDFGSDFPDYTWKTEVTLMGAQMKHLKKIILTVENKKLAKGNEIRLIYYKLIT